MRDFKPVLTKIFNKNEVLAQLAEPYGLNGFEYEEKIITAMETYGGSFVKQFAKLYRLADPQNQHKLVMAFTNYFLDYEKFLGKK